MTEALLKKITLIVLIVCSVGILGLSVLVYYVPVLTFDINVSHSLQNEGDSVLKKALILYFLKGVSYLGVPTVAIWLVLAFAFLFWILKYYRENLYCLLTLIAPGINALVKQIIHRPRPISQYVQIFDHEISPSFPSGHVVFYTVFFGYLFTTMFFVKKIPFWIRLAIVVISLILVISVSLSRIYLGAHWVTDAIGGYLLGFILLSILLYFYLRPKYKKNSES